MIFQIPKSVEGCFKIGMELLGSLLSHLKSVCAGFADPRKGRGGNLVMSDFGLSAFAMFFMQSSSFLSFQRRLEQGQGRSNCQSLFGIEKIPSDNYIRDMLDAADPDLLRPCFEQVEAHLHHPAMRSAFGRLGGRYLIALDGTEYFCSQKLSCPHCLTRKRANGKTESYHTLLAATVVAPGHKRILPLFPEFIAAQDGAEKQDCERNAVKRWHARHADRLRTLRPVYLADDLFACTPVITMLAGKGDDFLFTCKPGSHKALYDFMEGAEPERLVRHPLKGKKRFTHRYRWMEQVPLRDGKDAPLVNWIGFDILDPAGKVTYASAWVTSLPVNAATIEELVECARARWKVENEGFNVMKNHGYELEHNFGHGKAFLAMTLAGLNLLAFAWHSLLDCLDPPWQAARAAAIKRAGFFADMASITAFVVFPVWQDLIQALTTFKIPPELLSQPKIE